MSVAAIVLAAGLSRRMAPANKLLLRGADGIPMITRVVDHVFAAAIRPVFVVCGHRSEEIERALGSRAVRFVAAPDYAAGLSASLKAGIRAVPEACEAAVVCLGDMPFVTGAIIDRLLSAYEPARKPCIVVPKARGKRGNPVLWSRHYFPEILGLSGDAGARRLFAAHEEEIIEVEVADDAVLRDIDTPEALAALPKPF